ncbi:hypothetical protein ACRB68_76150 [Actinomadura sp. RB68]|uniref:Uncharacterized protein n=2 Tax=Actinomadura macrotermitis TaxID=2585200 RepID=A0A7K0C7P6_9ACTN|nr:hypothetical protein [Actinomadura macrotermitis]
MTKRPAGMGREKVRAVLGLARWEVELAAETGLLRRLEDRRFDPASVEAALADLDAFRRSLAREERCNATASAARLGVSVERFKRVAAAAGLEAVAEEEVRKYGKVLWVRYYRAGDVDGLADHVRADRELRAAARAVSRARAGPKAAATKKRNAELAMAAREEVERRRPGEACGPIGVLVWAVALMRAAGVALGWLRRFAEVDDPRVEELTAVVRRARFPQDALEARLAEIRPRALDAIGLLAGPRQVFTALGVPATAVPEHVDQFGGHVPEAALQELTHAPPPWLLHARAEYELGRAAAEVARQDAEELAQRWHVAESAIESAAKLSDAAVADLVGISVEVVRKLRPKSGRWSPEYVQGVLAARPDWIRSEEAAWREVERRRRKEQARLERNRQKRLAWRRKWAEVFGVPLDSVPTTIGRPTGNAIKAAREHPPRWARPPPDVLLRPAWAVGGLGVWKERRGDHPPGGLRAAL